MLLSDVFCFFGECCIRMYGCQFQFLLCGTFSSAVINCFVVDQDKRGPNISLVIPVRKKSKFYLRRKKEITGIRDTSFKNQISIESTKGKKKIDVSGQRTGMVCQRKWNFC